MFCSRCGRSLPPNSKTCPFCGSPVDDSRYCQFCDETTHYDSSDEPETICRSCGEMLGIGAIGGYCRNCLKDPKIYQKAIEREQLHKHSSFRNLHEDHGRVKTTLERLSQTAEQARPRTIRSFSPQENRDSSRRPANPRGCLIGIIFLMVFLPMLFSIGHLVFSLVVSDFSSSPQREPSVSAPVSIQPDVSSSSAYESLLSDPDYRRESVYSVAEIEMEYEFSSYYLSDAQFLSMEFDDSLYSEDYGYLWCGGTISYTRNYSQFEEPFSMCIMMSEESYYVIYFGMAGETLFDLRPIVDEFGCITAEGAENLTDYAEGDPVYSRYDPIYISY